MSVLMVLSIGVLAPTFRASAETIVTASLPINTKDTSVTVSGTAAPNSTITITGGAKSAAGKAANDGKFNVSVTLNPNRVNSLFVSSSAGGSKSIFIIQDSIAPKAPVLLTTNQSTTYTAITISGTAEAGSTLKLTGGVAEVTTTANSSGVFGAAVSLKPEADNTISVTCADAAGNVSPAATVTIKQVNDAKPDTTKPVTPTLTASTLLTKATTVVLSGKTEAECTVKLTGGLGNVTYTQISDENGEFSFTVPLNLNCENVFSVNATDLAGNVSDSATVKVTQDSLPPDKPVFTTQDLVTIESTVDVQGTAEAGSTVTVSGGSAAARLTADSTGSFKVTVTLNKYCDNILYAIATDKVGNESATSAPLKITHHAVPNAPSVATPSQTTTDYKITVKGSTTWGNSVSVTGGMYVVQTAAGTDGSYSMDVFLNPGVVNTLYVVATDGYGYLSKAASLIVTQKDFSNIPRLATPSQYTNSTIIGIAGTAQAGSKIRITGGKDTVVGVADGSGAFNIPVRLVKDVMNILKVSAIDSMGRESDASVVVITQGSAINTTTNCYVLTTGLRYINTGSMKYFNANAIKVTGTLDYWYLIVVTTLDDGRQQISSQAYTGNQAAITVTVDGRAIKSSVYVSDAPFDNTKPPRTYSLTGFVYN